MFLVKTFLLDNLITLLVRVILLNKIIPIGIIPTIIVDVFEITSLDKFQEFKLNIFKNTINAAGIIKNIMININVFKNFSSGVFFFLTLIKLHLILLI